MAGLLYVGAPMGTAVPGDDQDLVYRSYPVQVKTGDMSTGDIDTQINAALAAYIDKTYVDTQDGFNATQAYVDGGDGVTTFGDGGRVKLAQKDISLGVPSLDANLRVLTGKINAPNTQLWHRGPWSPASTISSQVTAVAETTLFTCPITDPGYTYNLLVFAQFDGQVNIDNGEHPAILVRTGSITGEVIAMGRGLAHSYEGIAGTDAFTSSSNWASVLSYAPLTITGGAVVADGTLRMGQWIGAQMATDELYIKWQLTTTGLGGQAVYFCGDTAWNQYMAIDIANNSFPTHDQAQFFSGSGGATPTTSRVNRGTVYEPSAGFQIGDTLEVRYDVPTNTFTLTHNGVLAITYVDTNNNVTHGVNNRLVALMTNAHNSGGGFPGPGFENFVLGNGLLASAPIKVRPTATQTAKTGATTLYVRLNRSGSAATVAVNPFNPQIYAIAVPA